MAITPIGYKSFKNTNKKGNKAYGFDITKLYTITVDIYELIVY